MLSRCYIVKWEIYNKLLRSSFYYCKSHLGGSEFFFGHLPGSSEIGFNNGLGCNAEVIGSSFTDDEG